MVLMHESHCHSCLGTFPQTMYPIVIETIIELNSTPHCEIFGSYLQKHHQHQVFKAFFQAEPHSKGHANKEKTLSYQITWYKLTAPGAIGIFVFPCSDRQTWVSSGQTDIYSRSEVQGRNSMIFFSKITSCGSVSLKPCICKAASPWSKSSFTDSQ